MTITSIQLGILGAIATTALASHVEAAVPLQIADADPRVVSVEVENSSTPDAVGQSYGPVFEATYSATGGVGTLVISAATHEDMYANYFPAPVSGSFTPYVIDIDLATNHATSQIASGSFLTGQISQGFTQGVLESDAVLGVIVSGVPTFTCPSQAAVDSLCPILPLFCGKTCSLVSGSAYDPATGKLNLVGTRTESGCDGAVCQGPFGFFATQGDLRLSERSAPSSVPALAPLATVLLLAALLAAARRTSKPEGAR